MVKNCVELSGMVEAVHNMHESLHLGEKLENFQMRIQFLLFLQKIYYQFFFPNSNLMEAVFFNISVQEVVWQ